MLINKFKKALKEKRLFATLKNKIAPYVIGLLIIFFKKKNKINLKKTKKKKFFCFHTILKLIFRV